MKKAGVIKTIAAIGGLFAMNMLSSCSKDPAIIPNPNKTTTGYSNVQPFAKPSGALTELIITDAKGNTKDFKANAAGAISIEYLGDGKEVLEPKKTDHLNSFFLANPTSKFVVHNGLQTDTYTPGKNAEVEISSVDGITGNEESQINFFGMVTAALRGTKFSL